LVIETSGTTGAPKRVALSAKAVIASAEAANQALGGPGHWLLVLPAHYIAGIQVATRAMLGGTTPEVLHPDPFSTVAMASKVTQLLENLAERPLYTSVVPAQLQRILDDAPVMPALDELMRSCSRILVGGQAIQPSLLDRAAERGWKVTRTYGSSETAGGCVWDQRPIGDVTVDVIDGRLALAGSVLATEYLDDPERTRASFIEREGTRWYLSDDAGFVDGDGLVYVLGRVDDVIVSGGVKVSLAAVERVVQTQLGAGNAYVVGVADDQWGHVPVIVSTEPLDLASARSAVAEALGVEARPDRVVVVSQIPMLATGKPDRLALEKLTKESV
jgi:O-succinylbenzoic acid--CoA ligase